MTHPELAGVILGQIAKSRDIRFATLRAILELNSFESGSRNLPQDHHDSQDRWNSPYLATRFLPKRVGKMRSSDLTNFTSNHYIPMQQRASSGVLRTLNAIYIPAN